MKLEDQCCTLQQAKRLKELGIEQISYFIWGERGVITEGWSVEGYEDTFYAAYNVAELGLMLPKSLPLNDGHHWAFYHRHCWKGESVGYSAYGRPSIEQDWFVTEAEARATMIIGLLENALVTAEEINQRLTK